MNLSGRPPLYSPANLELNQDQSFPPRCLTPDISTCRLTPDITTCRLTPDISTCRLTPDTTTCRLTPDITTCRLTPDITTCPDFPTEAAAATSQDGNSLTFGQRIRRLVHHESIQSVNGATKITRQLGGQPTTGNISIEQDNGSESSIFVVISACILLIFCTFLFVIPFPEMIVGYKYMDVCNDWFSIWLCVTGTLLLVTWIYVFLIICLGINTLVLIVINVTMLAVWWTIGMYWCWISPTPLPEYKQPPKYKQRNFGGFFLDEVYLEQFEYEVCRQQFYFVYSLCWVHLCLFFLSFLACTTLFLSLFIKTKNYPTDV